MATKITTESGSVYTITDGICRKTDSDGNLINSFKVFFQKAVPESATTLKEAQDFSNGEIEIGKRMYIGGKDNWWITTPIVDISEGT